MHSPVQTILLVDTFSRENLSESSNLQKIRCISLTSFRILSSLLSSWESETTSSRQLPFKDSGLKWSYKFFSSGIYKSGTKQDKLKDFKLRYFEQYEAKLEEKLSLRNSPKTKRTSKVTPSECLQKSLAEIVTDIQWESPDTASPMKGKRNVKHKQRRKNHNIVFLFMDLPANTQEMRYFAGKRVLDSEILLDAVMPPHLFEQFINHARLSLVWIDTSSVHAAASRSERPCDAQCMEIISHTLRRVGGAAVPVEHFLNVNSTVCEDWKLGKFALAKAETTSLPASKESPSKCNRNESSVHKQINEGRQLKKDSLLSQLIPSHSVVHGLTQKTRHVSGSVPESVTLHVTVDGTAETLELKLQTISEQEISSCAHSNPVSDTSFVKIDLKSSENPRSFTFLYDNHLLPDNLDLSGCFCMSKKMLAHQTSFASMSYLAMETSQGDTTRTSTLLKDLLFELREQEKVLVLKMESKDYVVPYLALLDCFTCDKGLLSILSLGSTLQVEKACLSQVSESSSHIDPSRTDCKLSRLDAAVRKQVKSVKCSVKTDTGENVRTGMKCVQSARCYDPQVLNTWHLPGSSRMLPGLITKLNSRLQDLHFLSGEEKQMLKSLQKMYRQDNQPQNLLQKSQLQVTPTQPETFDLEMHVNADDDSGGQSAKGKNSRLNRGMLMVSRSKAAAKKCVKSGEDAENTLNEKDNDKRQVDLTHLDLKTEASLVQYIHEMYQQTLAAGTGLEPCVQTLVTVAVHFMKETQVENPESSAVQLLQREIVLSSSALREKYKSGTSDPDNSFKITEYKLQTLLQLEMESAVLSADESQMEKCVDEVVNLLRTLSFITDTGFVPQFLSKVIVTSYEATLPRLLVGVYDELMQPLPESLAMFASPNKSADSSVLNTSLQSQDSVQGPASNNNPDVLSSQSTRNLRKKKVIQHPSLSDYGNKKQIMVMKKSKAGAAKPKEKEKLKRQRSVQPSTKSKKTKSKLDIVQVRRNLFEGDKPKLERRQSVAVMERPRKSPQKKQTLPTTFKSPQASKSPGSRRRSVAETPAHKQLSHSIRNRLEKKRKRTATEEEVEVVQESPLKPAADNWKKVSPSRNKHMLNMMRRSFYSAGPRNRSRNLTKYFQFADRIAGRQQRLSLGDMPQSDDRPQYPLKSPSRSSFLMSQLMASPSPRHKTPSKSANSVGATTPKSTVSESPFRNTRSRTPRNFSKVLLFNSPEKKETSDCENVMVSSETPVKSQGTPKKNMGSDVPSHNTRSQTPRKLAEPDSRTEQSFALPSLHSIPSTPKRTPRHQTDVQCLLSPAALPATPQRSILKNSQSSSKRGLDLTSTPQRTPSRVLICESPSLNTRSHSATPSRNSVCTALFMKSPRGRMTPRGKLFGDSGTESPRRRVHFDAEGTTTPRKETEIQTLTNPVMTKTVENISFVGKDGTVTSLTIKSPSSSPKESGSGSNIRTPSPQKQTKVKTPDSFDKWPRRKRRFASPTQSVCSKYDSSVEWKELHCSADSGQGDIQKNTNFDLDSSQKENTDASMQSATRKRSFAASVQDSSSVFSPLKRYKPSWTDSVSSREAADKRYCLHQRVSSLAAGNLGSDTSDLSLDYFSSTNDEVFLPNQELETVSLGSSILENSGMSDHRVTRSQGHATPRSESPVFGANPNVSHLLQEEHATVSSTSSQGFEVLSQENSPKFITSPVLSNKYQNTRTRTPCSKNSSSFTSPKSRKEKLSPSPAKAGVSQGIQSPHPRTSSIAESPRDKKYSPSVSARSLVHLMNSPIISFDANSPVKNSQNERVHSRSRKSLNMQN